MHERFDDGLNAIEKAARLLRHATRMTVLTGAGISAESGVPTFRGCDGLWEGHRIEDVATPQAFRLQPATVWRFYNQRRANLRDVHPNPGHLALAALERDWFGDGRFTLITQNVDGLHRTAGTARVLEIHGNIRRTRCTSCGDVENRALEPLDELPRCPDCTGLLRPDIVWFNEMLPSDVWEQAEIATLTCDVFLIVGTSAVVYPAAGLIGAAKSAGAKLIEINLERTAASELADVSLIGPSGRLLPQILDHLRAMT